MEATTPSCELSASDQAAIESLDRASFEVLEMLERERVISGDLLAESARVLEAYERCGALTTRAVGHLVTLRAFLGGAFYMDTQES
jgi:hypothetical protein